MSLLLHYGDGPRAICDNLRTRILSGEIGSGRELKIQALADEFGVSAVPVREALRTLAAQGLVEMRPRRSPVVAAPDANEILDVNEIRYALEPVALDHAIANHSPATLDRCWEIIEIDRQTADAWEKVDLNRRFHTALLAPAGKERLLKLIDAQYGTLGLLGQSIVIQSCTTIGEPHAEHERILTAVGEGDRRLARDLLEVHLRESNERIRTVLADDSSV